MTKLKTYIEIECDINEILTFNSTQMILSMLKYQNIIIFRFEINNNQCLYYSIGTVTLYIKYLYILHVSI